MKSVTILLLYVTEFVFYEQAAGTFRTEESLAGFLGLFFGAMTMVMVLVTGLFSGRYISRFGIRAATLTLPVGHARRGTIAGALRHHHRHRHPVLRPGVRRAGDGSRARQRHRRAGRGRPLPADAAGAADARSGSPSTAGSARLALFGSGLLLLAFNAARDLDSRGADHLGSSVAGTRHCAGIVVARSSSTAGLRRGAAAVRDLTGTTTSPSPADASDPIPPRSTEQATPGPPRARPRVPSPRPPAAGVRRSRCATSNRPRRRRRAGTGTGRSRSSARPRRSAATSTPISRSSPRSSRRTGTSPPPIRVVGDALREEFDLGRRSIYAALAVEYDAGASATSRRSCGPATTTTGRTPSRHST